MLIVFRTEINVGGQKPFAYTSDEVDNNGKPINYLNNNQLAELIGLDESTTRQNRLSKELKASLGNDFNTRQGKVKTSQNNYIKVSLWDIDSCVKYLNYHAGKGNQRAFNLVCVLAATNLDIIINDAFDRDYQKGQAQRWANNRAKGKEYRRTATDAIDDWLKQSGHLLSENEKKFIWIHFSEGVNKGVFDRTSVKLKKDWKLGRDELLRDRMTERELQLVQQVEDTFVRILDKHGEHMKPLAALHLALEGLYIPVQTR